MRNPLKRLGRPDRPKRPLRERLTAAKGKLVAVREKYGRTLRVHRALNAPIVKPEPVERTALVNYATFLALEREQVCAELYPHMGVKAGRFVLSLNEAWAFFHRHGDSTGPRDGLAPASSRALEVLDLVGIDWRKDGDHIDRRYGGDLVDSGERPAVPYGWPALDAELTEALDDLTRLDAAIEALHSGNPDRDTCDVPGYADLERIRESATDRLAKGRAQSLPGLQAKAHALLSECLAGGGSEDFEKISSSLARDLIGARPQVLDQLRPDPIFAAIEDVKRLEAAAEAGEAETPKGQDVSPEYGAAVWASVNDTLLKTVPTTAHGCQALATFVPGFFERWGSSYDDGLADTLFKLIARSPLRA